MLFHRSLKVRLLIVGAVAPDLGAAFQLTALLDSSLFLCGCLFLLFLVRTCTVYRTCTKKKKKKQGSRKREKEKREKEKDSSSLSAGLVYATGICLGFVVSMGFVVGCADSDFFDLAREGHLVFATQGGRRGSDDEA